jgi:hypothetical protein
MVPTVYQRFINAVNALTTELGDGVSSADAEMVEVWQPFIAEALALPAQHRCELLTPLTCLTTITEIAC